MAEAVAQASSCSCDSSPGLGTSTCHGCGPKKTKNKQIRGEWKVPESTLSSRAAVTEDSWGRNRGAVEQGWSCLFRVVGKALPQRAGFTETSREGVWQGPSKEEAGQFL